jgi:hypothetical protein
LKERGSGICEEARRFLEEIIWRAKTKKFVTEWDELLKDVKPSEKGFSIKSMRRDLEGH